jgi:hypothetical protein
VLWDDNGTIQEGVFIPRPDTNTQLNRLLGGRVFPGEHHKAEFKAHESADKIELSMKSEDGDVSVDVVGRIAEQMPKTSIFRSLAETSSFFEAGSLGDSVTTDAERLDGLRLYTKEWRVEALDVERVYSSYFGNKSEFTKGSVAFDHALIMKNIAHEWHTASDLHV